ncbi:MAG: hypothetical protein AB2L11_00700 [Syntrophobacteraceae bacterium]
MNFSELLQTSLSAGEKAIQPSGIYIDEEGEWFYNGNQIYRQDFLALFMENVQPASGGGFLINWNGQNCMLDAADTPFVITRTDIASSGEAILLRLKHLADVEILDPSTLSVGEGNVLYCRIRNGLFRARFSRPAYYQFAEWIEEDQESGAFYINLGGKRWSVAGAA